MTNYIEDIKTVDRFAAEANPKLKEKKPCGKRLPQGALPKCERQRFCRYRS